MPKMTKTQMKKRIYEARGKIKAVYMSETTNPVVLTTQEMAAIEKIIDRILKRLG